MSQVPGLARDTRLETLLGDLEAIGYNIVDAVRLRDAAEFGVPQRRRRLVLMTARGRPLSHPEPERPTSPQTVRQAIENLPSAGTSGDALHDLPERRSARVMAIIRAVPPDGGSRSDLGDDAQLDCHRKSTGFWDVYGRMAWDEPSPTITGGCFNPSKGRFLHPVHDRAITLREAIILQGFPKDYMVSLSRGKEWAAQMIGNALPPPLVQAHAESILRQLSPI